MADHNLRASGYAVYGTSVFGQEQYGGHVRSEVEVSQPSLGVVLNADNISTTSEVTSSDLDQTHVLLRVNVESTSSITNPDVDELNILDANDVSSATTLTIPSTGQLHNLEATSVESNTSVTSPSVDQVHTLNATDVRTGGAGSALSIDSTYGTTYLRELTSFPSNGFSSGSGGAGKIDVTYVFDMTFSTTDTGCILDQGGVVDGTYVGMLTGGNLRLSASGAVLGASQETSTTTTDMSTYAGVAGQLIVTIDYQNHIQCWWNDSANSLNQIVSVDFNGNGDWAGTNVAKVGGVGSSIQGAGNLTSDFTGTITRYREFDNNYVDLSSVSLGGAANET
jgi:hypothetical protein